MNPLLVVCGLSLFQGARPGPTRKNPKIKPTTVSEISLSFAPNADREPAAQSTKHAHSNQSPLQHRQIRTLIVSLMNSDSQRRDEYLIAKFADAFGACLLAIPIFQVVWPLPARSQVEAHLPDIIWQLDVDDPLVKWLLRIFSPAPHDAERFSVRNQLFNQLADRPLFAIVSCRFVPAPTIHLRASRALVSPEQSDGDITKRPELPKLGVELPRDLAV